MSTLTLIYDYVQARGQWKICDLRDEYGASQVLPRKSLYAQQIAELSALLEDIYPNGMPEIVMQQRDRCYEKYHEIAKAKFGFWSNDKTKAYLICSCGRRRAVSYEDLLQALGTAKMPD